MLPSAIILAGGLGTRLQPVVQDVPKPMALVNGKPFLQYLLRYLNSEGIQQAILCVGYKWESIRNYFGEKHLGIQISYSVEDEPLGTGGAMRKAISNADEAEFIVLNGDSYFPVPLQQLIHLHQEKKAQLSIALKSMKNFSRYGRVITDENSRIISFEEKGNYTEGKINGGVYFLNRKIFSGQNLPDLFSFEKEILEQQVKTIPMFGFGFDQYFIDIGIPEDYEKATRDLIGIKD